MRSEDVDKAWAKGPDQLIGITEGGKSAIRVTAVLVSLSVIIAAFAITTC